jgi:pyruvyl transferase EpsO
MIQGSTVMLSLKDRLSTIADRIDRQARFIYVDYPLHPNIGDLLINQGTEDFFATHQLNIWRRYSYHDFPGRLTGVGDGDIFLFHGGGNFGDLYPEHVNLLLHILKEFPRNQVVVLPQTVFFKNERHKEAICNQMRNHTKLRIYVRDLHSLDELQKSGLNDITAMPDMAHHLAGKLIPDPLIGGGDPLYFIRRDEEGGKIPSTISFDSRETVDWVDSISARDRIAFIFLIRAVRGLRAVNSSISLYRLWYRLRDSTVRGGVELLSRSTTIYTNRLHAVLLGLLLGRNVIAFDNSYGKLSEYYQTWLSEVPNLKFLKTEASC